MKHAILIIVLAIVSLTGSARNTNPDYQPYKFGGKEFQHAHGLNLYDFHARQYDPATGLFTSMDPLCEKYYHISPYAYCMGNPVNAVDPDGRSTWTKVLKATLKIGKQAFKSGGKALWEGATYANAVSGLVDDFNTLTDHEESRTNRIWAGVSLASEILPVSVGDVKDVRKVSHEIRLRAVPNEGRAKPHGGKIHNERIDEFIRNLKKDLDVDEIRKNQRQVDIDGNTIGRNRPDVQFNKSGKHHNVEFDRNIKSSEKHRMDIETNDPYSINEYYLIK